ncbi:MAG TPA: PRC-barrel domain-containing protein [Geminicoccaceae bacterium]|nr:PRC-barrel domain-containing protein [Geminicoccaceae bacterium]
MAPAPGMAQQPPAGEAEQQATEEAAPPADMEFIQVQEEKQFLADDEVIGASVVNQGGDEIGKIADLVMDEDQKLVGVVLSVGGFLGLGAKWVAVPVEQISFPTGDEPARLLASVSEEQLANAPDFITRKAIEQQEAAQSQPIPQQAPAPAPVAPTQ